MVEERQSRLDADVVQMVEERQSRVDADVMEVAIEDKQEESVLGTEKQKES